MALSLAYREAGRGHPLVILHGLFGSSRNWATVAQQLAGTYRVFTLDLRNHGDSPWSDEMDYEAMADDVAAFIQSEGIEGASLVGHSMGGKVAMVVALEQSALIRDLMVVDIAPVAYRHGLDAYVEAMRSLDLTTLKRRADADALLRPSVAEQGVRGFLLQNLVTRDGGLSWRLNLEVLHRSMAVIGGFPEPLTGERFDRRTLFLGGGQSDYILPDHQPLIERLFPSAVIKTIPDAGHWVHAEAPDQFLRQLQAFLAAGTN